MTIEVTEAMLEAAEKIQECDSDDSYWIHLADATYKALIDQGILEEKQ